MDCFSLLSKDAEENCRGYDCSGFATYKRSRLCKADAGSNLNNDSTAEVPVLQLLGSHLTSVKCKKRNCSFECGRHVGHGIAIRRKSRQFILSARNLELVE